MRYVFKVKRDGSLSTNNPDDIALLQVIQSLLSLHHCSA